MTDADKPGGYDLYGQLLASFIRDVRKDLSAPKMPFVIGVMGIGGLKEDEEAGQPEILPPGPGRRQRRFLSSRATWWR